MKLWRIMDGDQVLVNAVGDGEYIGSHTVEETTEDVKPVYLGYPHGPETADWVPDDRKAVTHRLTVTAPDLAVVSISFQASPDSFPCEIGDAPFVRTAVGAPGNRRDRAVYDRQRDSLLCIERADAWKIERLPDTGAYVLVAHGRDIEVTWRPGYYRDHLGYFLLEPTENVWTAPVAGWCSWMAHGQDVTQQDMLAAAEFFEENLKDYGFDVIQMDDGFQRVPQMRPEGFATSEAYDRLWTEADPGKFPNGLSWLAGEIEKKGLTPGIWIGMYLPMREGFEGYVTDEGGEPYRGPWVNYAADATDPPAVDEAYLRTIRGLREQGWRYFKLDTLRHVLYDNYRLNERFWTARGTDSSHAFRDLFRRYREAVGEDIYCLACWGTLPEIAGLPDGCRIGEDVGPNWKSIELAGKYIAQFAYLNNVVWRNDPDYMCFRVPLEQCRFWASLLALTCSQLMVSDPVSTYDRDRLDILQRIGPPMFGRPRVLGPLDRKEFWILQVEQDSSVWTLVGRFAWQDLPATSLSLSNLGVDPTASYFAWDFWEQHRIGPIQDSIDFIALPQGTCTIVSLHQSEDRSFAWPTRGMAST